ncbi:MAG: aldehyde dehydrogenase family protein [Gemmatimonadales bacterium]|nr:aldehyde dehydrogenase family protein [Gemmatimonadales bacterium]NIN50198.1 aldehyde dehydrogenase family protein [Gemmatimonadales bacterium]NIP07662.1 aldehyde dehydrogenase family protein [Gemmatimonadales bacterium]NIR01814.1 aldehyde dehydrogenase family protein [Gemmatimonadales bacterium]NIS65717.1 aldehyde dehydrogenase family protein [Gemmatimonadales bacterium]
MEYGPAPESDAAALSWIKQRGGQFGLFIGGQWVKAESGQSYDSVNPATTEPLARISQAGGADVAAAVQAARAAFPNWSSVPGHARARHLYALGRAVQKHSRLLAVLESLDNGKPIRETRDLDIPLVARHFYHHAGWSQLLETEFTGYVPVGVVGQIIPWNFPLLMVAWKVAPALAAGNTVVLKPAEFTPLTALAFAEITRDAGLPHGVFNVVTGDGETGKLLVEHPDVDKIAFTGSTEVGRFIRHATAGSGKRLILELGGKSPFVVFDDADLDSVVEGVVDAIWFNQGQVCCAGSRLLVHEGIAERLLDKLRARMEKLRVGPPQDKAVDMGAIVAPVQLERIRELVNRGVEEGAAMWQPSWACPTEGYFYPPTLFTNVSPAATIAQVEIFGPVLVSMTFRTPAEAVELANNTTYGLAASVWTENMNLALDIAPRIKAGVVWINSTNLFDAASGFGGYRESGFGREGGREGMWEYLRPDWEEGAGSAERAPQARPERQAGTATEPLSAPGSPLPQVDRTYKMFIGGKQCRPDSGYSRTVRTPDGQRLSEVGEGNRKDIRNAVEAAHAAAAWGRDSSHYRAQILYYVAENLSPRTDEFARLIHAMTRCGAEAARHEVEASISRLFTYAAWADKYDGAVHDVPLRGVTLAMNEPIGVMGLVAPDEYPLLGFISLVAPAIAVGNRVVAVPSEVHPVAAAELYSVLETSDLPAGVVNIVTGSKDTLTKVLAEHADVEGVWFFGSADGASEVERASASNLKRTWVDTRLRDWFDVRQGEGREFLREATQVKNIWIPYGE